MVELRRQLSGARGDANYWRSQHARARERAARWQQEAAQLAAEGKRKQKRGEQLEQQVEALEQQVKDLKRKPFARRSEKRQGASDKDSGSGSGQAEGGSQPGPRRRGGQPGAPAHGRVEREGLEVVEETHEPEDGRCQCPHCGRPYRHNGEQVSDRVEVEVKAHVRRIRRPRYRAVCECAAQRGERVPDVVAELEPTLFRGSGYGLSVWVLFVLQVYWQRHPARAFEREWGEYGVRLPASTLLGHVADLLGWFEPLQQAIAAHQREAALAQGDETSWMVHVRQERGQNARCWLWVCVSADAIRMRVDPSRSAEAAAELFGELGQRDEAVLMCDCYAAYGKLQRQHGGKLVLAHCWAHVRRWYLELGRSRPDLQPWVDAVMEQIGELYRRNAERLQHWDREQSLEQQCAAFQHAQAELEQTCSQLFEQAGQQLQEMAGNDPRRGPVQALLKHREGLEVFLTNPRVPLDNNAAERALRRAVIGRKLSFGSHSEGGAALQGVLLSVLATLQLAGIDLRRWLQAFLRECAGIGPRAVVVDPHAWLPWGLPQSRLRELQARGRRSEPGPDP